MVNCDSGKVCMEHQTAFKATCGFFILVMLTMIGYMVINDRRASAAEKEITQSLNDAKLQAAHEHDQMMQKYSERLDTNFKEVFQRLSRIEARQGQVSMIGRE